MSAAECLGCGCTDAAPCVDAVTGLLCSWVAPGWCSACADPDDLLLDPADVDADGFRFDAARGLFLPGGGAW